MILACQSGTSPSELAVDNSKAVHKADQDQNQGKVTKNQRRLESPTGVLTDTQLSRMLHNRDEWQQPLRVIEAAGIKKGDIVADIGCGAGYWTYYLSNAVGASGKVYAVDFDPNATTYLRKRMKENLLDNVEILTSKSHDIMLPENSIDHAMLVNVHFLLRPDEMNRSYSSQVLEDFPDFYGSIHKALRKDGQMIFVESSKEEHVSRGVDAKQISTQLQSVNFAEKSKFDWLEPRQYFMLYSLTEQ